MAVSRSGDTQSMNIATIAFVGLKEYVAHLVCRQSEPIPLLWPLSPSNPIAK
jgi:hypothetical protein